jgi:SPP1 family predicted phage head-tail adaptor
MIKSGELTDRIVFERSQSTQSSNGDLVTIFVPILTTFAKVREKSGGYSFETGSINSESRISIIIRYRPDIALVTGDRVEWRGFSWILENSPVVDAKRTMIIMEATLKIETSDRGGQNGT